MWVETRANENDQSKRGAAFADISVHNAVNAELNRRGWREVTENPDVLVSYDILVERNVERKSDPVYSQPFTRSYFNPYTRRWSVIYYPSSFQGYDVYNEPVREGTVTITMVDARTDKNVMQGWVTDRLGGSRPSDDEIRRSVRSIFKEVS